MRTLTAEWPAPWLVAIWVLALQNAFGRRDALLRTPGDGWKGAGRFELGMENFGRSLAHPEGVEIARAIDTDLQSDPDYPFVRASD
jgi:hypothetical protein